MGYSISKIMLSRMTYPSYLAWFSFRCIVNSLLKQWNNVKSIHYLLATDSLKLSDLREKLNTDQTAFYFKEQVIGKGEISVYLFMELVTFISSF